MLLGLVEILFFIVVVSFIFNIPAFAVEFFYWQIYLHKLPLLRVKSVKLVFSSWLLRLLVLYVSLIGVAFFFKLRKSQIPLNADMFAYIFPHLASALYIWLRMKKDHPEKSKMLLIGAIIINALTLIFGYLINSYLSKEMLESGGF